MKLTLEYVFAIAWRAAIIALPWQTRWIFSTPNVSGFPWEQGMVVSYASWILIAIAIIAGFKKGAIPTISATGQRPYLLLIAGVLLVGASLFTASSAATLLWWSHVILLGLFAWTLWRNGVTRTDLTTWIAISIIPHAFIGIWQSFVQAAPAASFLGMAVHEPWQSGTSVVEYGEYRVLRAYGGFPHPNILGGWLAVGLALLPDLARRATSWLRFVWIGCATIFPAALILTFSRGAWIAALVGLVIAAGLALHETKTMEQRQAVWAIGLIATVISVFFLLYHWEAFVTRLGTYERLEHWSIAQRTTSLVDGIAAWRERPITGWGPGASVIAISTIRPSVVVAAEPPHVAPLAALVETGVMGILGCAILAFVFVRALIQKKNVLVVLPFVAVAGVIAGTDHYLWTLWAGHALLAVVLLMGFLREEKLNF